MELEDFEKDGGKPVAKTCDPCRRNPDAHLGAVEDYDYAGVADTAWNPANRNYFGFRFSGGRNDPDAMDFSDMM